MRVTIVVESLYGNTRNVADAIAEGFGPEVRVKVVDVATLGATVPDDADLVLVGGPTHAHGMSRPATRDASGAGDPRHVATGVREWLTSVPTGQTVAAASFDTRLPKPEWLVGSAAHGIGRQLKKLGCRVVAPPMSFFVCASEGPLEDGELDRASAWGGALALAFLAHR